MRPLVPTILFPVILLISMETMAQVKSTYGQPISDVKNKSKTQIDPGKAAGWLKDDKTGFIGNKGQLRDQNGKPNAAVKYLLNMPGLNVQLRATGFSYDAWIEEKGKQGNNQNKVEKTASITRKFHRVDIELEGANPNARLVAEEPLAEAVNVINEHGSFEGIHSYRKVTYRNIYPGVDLEFVARKVSDKPVEYNFIVHPGADASRIRMKYNGQNSIGLKQGKIEMMLNHGKLSEHIPASWIAGTRKQLAVRYEARDRNVYAFSIPAYNKNETLIIDPTPNLEWATYYGGSAVDQVAAVTTDSEGNIYVAGLTASSTNIATAGAYDVTYGGGVTGINPNEDAFIAKFTTNGQRVWATYYGGAGRDSATALTLKGNVLYLGGTSTSTGMATAGAHQISQSAANQRTGFLAKFDATTGQRTWGTYYGGNIAFQPARIDIDDQDNFYVYGSFITWGATPTPATALATPGTFRPTLPTVFINVINSALAKFNAAGVRQWATYIDYASNTPFVSTNIGGQALDADGQVYVSGASTSADLAANATEGQTVAGSSDGFLLKINKANGQRTWGRLFGGPSSDYIIDICIDKAGQTIYAVGTAKSASGISTPGAFIENQQAGYQTAGILFRASFFASFDLSGVRKMGTYLNRTTLTGTSQGTHVAGITQDNQGNLNIVGQANDAAQDLSTNCSYQPNLNISGTTMDVFVNRFTQQGQRIWGTYLGTTATDYPFPLGGIGDARGKSIVTDPRGNVIVIYNTSVTGAATVGSHQSSFGGGTFDGVIAKLNAGLTP